LQIPPRYKKLTAGLTIVLSLFLLVGVGKKRKEITTDFNNRKL